MATLQDPTIDLPDRARLAATILDEEAPHADEHGRLSERAVDALHDHGMFGMWVPESLGGSEADPVASIETLEALAYGDTNASWVLMAAALSTGTAGLYLGEEAIEQLFGNERFPVIAGQGTMPGKANQVDGGFRLNGKWSFASGLKHAQYIHTLAIIEETGEPRIFVLPKEQATLIDNWDVLGLKGTGSIDYHIEDVFVPEAFTHFAVTDEGKGRADHLHRMTVLGFACICHSGWALGLGRRILDELAKNVRAKAGRAGTLADSDAYHQGYATAEGKLRAARAYIMEVQGDVQDTIRAGDSISDHQRTMSWHSLQHATWAVADIGTWAYYTSGTSGLRAGRMQQLFRDLHAGTQHVTSSPKVVGATGRKLAGLADGEVWQGVGLVPAH